ncbi:structural protein P5 [Pseudomonas syringae]|uniref:Structural protein P5 n=1 Tax=Pseudomonas syringae TaxID=317 RepID=A0A085V6S4_PSESX|nr:structural protein P5 [Pseudomonas syringae]KFE51137.1 structural protein P5 [Pseudomonas syringae]
MTIARGLRNNNPGNIDYNPRNDWQGQLPPDPTIEKRFARFDTPENGIRALAKLLINYRGKDGMPGVGLQGIDTVREAINRWAPSVENNTDAYVKAVSVEAGVLANESIDIRDRRILLGIVTAIIKHENGSNPYSPDVIADGVRRALS